MADISTQKREFDICYVVSSEMTVTAFLKDHIRYIHKYHPVTVAANINDEKFLTREGIDVPVKKVNIQRKISILNDINSLYKLYKIFRQGQYRIIHSVTPKAGLLAMLAAKLAGAPIRLHTFTGQVWANKKGAKRIFYKMMDALIAWASTGILVDSASQREFLINEGIISSHKSTVLLHGSICGVDSKRFIPDPDAREKIRNNLNISEMAIIFLYLGRLNRDKGLLDLVEAFSKVHMDNPDVYLLVVGPDEGNLKIKMKDICHNCNSKLLFRDYTRHPEEYMAASDVFVLPSYREGFGSVIIEAGATGLPSIGSRIYGISDAIEDGVTGYLFSAGESEELSGYMKKMSKDTSLIRMMGERARKRAIELFDQEPLSEALLTYYETKCGEARG